LGRITETDEHDPLQSSGMNPVYLVPANISEDQLAILFSSPIVEYFVSILGDQHDVVGDLTEAMAKLRNSKAYHILALDGWYNL
jgi:hypothetical protein